MSNKAYFILVLSLGLFAQAKDKGQEDLFDLSIEELLNVQISGAAVRDLGLTLVPETDNILTKNILELPLTVEIIDFKTIEARALRNVVEVTENMVGVLSGESPSEPYSFSMRGFTRDSVKLLFDGVNMGSATLNMRPIGTAFLERVEVVKGASAMHHGQGSAAGTVNIIPKSATLVEDHIQRALFSVGNYQQTTINVDLMGPISPKGAYRFDFERRASDGWVDDSDSESNNLILSTFWEMSPNNTFHVFMAYLEDDLPAYWGTPLVPRSRAAEPTDIVETEDDRVFDRAVRWNNYNVADKEIRSENFWIKANFSTKMGHLNSKSSIYFYKADRDWHNAETYIFQPENDTVLRDRLAVHHDRKLWGFNSHISGKGSIGSVSHEMVLSLEHSCNDFAREVGFDQENFFVDEVDYRNPVPGPFGDISHRDDTLIENHTSVLVKDHLSLNERWHVNAALKWEHLGFDRERYNFDGSPRTNFFLDRSFDQFSYRLGVIYQLDNWSAYFQQSKHHDDIAGDLATGFVANAMNFEPSDLKQTEIGWKGALLEGKLELSLSAYHLKKLVDLGLNNDQVQQKSTGIELSFCASPNEDFKIGGNLSHVDAAFKDQSIDQLFGTFTPVNVPETMSSIWASFQCKKLPVEFGGSINGVSDRWANQSNTVRLNGYELVHGFVNITWKKYRLAFHLRNILDEVYAPWSDEIYPDQTLVGAPRTFEITFRAVF